MSKIWKPEDSREPPAPTPTQRAHGSAKYGIVDTTFATVDMGSIAVSTLREIGIAPQRIVRRTVPGFKDLAVAALQMLRNDGCAIVVACGMPGPEPIDKQCGHEASLAIGQAQLMAGAPILEVFVHMDEARSDAELIRVATNRVAEHAVNAYWMVERPEELVKRAGTGQRQGFSDVGPADPAKAEAGHLKPASQH
jgi:riboflavin synthase